MTVTIITESLYRSQDGEREVMALYDTVLARWPVPYESLTVPTRHGDTFIISSGKKSSPALVLLHGLCSNAVSWIDDIAGYSKYFRTYAVDIPGEPGKSAPNCLPWNTPAYAEWMEDILNVLKIQKVYLLGISYGGWLSIKFATYLSERIEKLVLLTPVGVVPVRKSFVLGCRLISVFGNRGYRAINRITLHKQSIQSDTVRFMDAIMAHFKARSDGLVMFTDEELRRLTMPVLLMGGKQDIVQDLDKITVRMKKLAPNLESRVFPDKGHVLVNLAGEVTPFLTDKE